MNILRGLLGGSKTGRTEGAKENGGATKEEKGDLDVALIKKIGEGRDTPPPPMYKVEGANKKK